MKRRFVKTQNVKHFISAVTRLQDREEEIPGLALIYGKYGLGRTRTAVWWSAQNEGAIFIRTLKLMTGRWLLSKIVAELGEEPMYRVSDLFEQCQGILLDGKQRVLIFDEVDYLTHDARVIETLRDIHDITGVPMVFIGMEHADKKLMRYKHLYDRFSEVLQFNEQIENDIRTIADEMCEVKLSDCAVKYLYQSSNRFRPLVVNLYKAERLAKTNNYKVVTAAHLQNGRRK